MVSYVPLCVVWVAPRVLLLLLLLLPLLEVIAWEHDGEARGVLQLPVSLLPLQRHAHEASDGSASGRRTRLLSRRRRRGGRVQVPPQLRQIGRGERAQPQRLYRFHLDEKLVREDPREDEEDASNLEGQGTLL